MMDRNAHVAQLAEHVLGKDEVTRSIRVVGSSGTVLGEGWRVMKAEVSDPALITIHSSCFFRED